MIHCNDGACKKCRSLDYTEFNEGFIYFLFVNVIVLATCICCKYTKVACSASIKKHKYNRKIVEFER